MKIIKLLILLLISLNQSFSHAAQESKLQDEPFAIVPFDQHVESTVEEYPGINQTFAFLQEQGLVNQSFRQFLQRELGNNEDVNDQRGANFGKVLDQAREIIATNMKGRFISTLDVAMKEQKTLNQFHDPIFLYVMQHKDDSMHDVVRDWLRTWSNTKDNSGYTPLHLAAFYKAAKIAYMLISANVNLNIQDNHCTAPLHMASCGNSPEIASLLITAGANLNIQDRMGYTPLHWAISAKYYEVARLLINAGADLNLCDKNRRTLLHLACASDSLEIIRLLIAKGVNLNPQDYQGRTPLHSTAYADSSEPIRMIINKGADASIQDYQGCTPLHLATSYYPFKSQFTNGINTIEVIRVLIDASTNVNLLNNNGYTAEQCAETPEIQALFIQARQNARL